MSLMTRHSTRFKNENYGPMLKEIGHDIREAQHNLKSILSDRDQIGYLCSASMGRVKLWPPLDSKELSKTDRIK